MLLLSIGFLGGILAEGGGTQVEMGFGVGVELGVGICNGHFFMCFRYIPLGCVSEGIRLSGFDKY